MNRIQTVVAAAAAFTAATATVVRVRSQTQFLARTYKKDVPKNECCDDDDGQKNARERTEKEMKPKWEKRSMKMLR